MIIKHGLKLLNAFCLSLKHKIMPFARQSYQVLGAIITFNPIKMVDMPALWKRFIVCLLPYQNMFKNTSLFRSTRVCGSRNPYISPTSLLPSTLPSKMFIALPEASTLANAPQIFYRTTIATSRVWMNKFATIWTGMSVPFSPRIIISLLHILSITHFHKYINKVWV